MSQSPTLLRRILTLVCAGALLAACDSATATSSPTTEAPTTTEPTTVATAAPTTVQATTTTEPATTTTEPPQPVYPLTGLPATDPFIAARPAVVVKVGNYDAHPQQGTNYADIVYEEMINDHVSRFAMIFHSQATQGVGPIRSGRLQDVNLLGSLNRAILAWSGGNGTVTREIDSSDLINLSQSLCQGACYRSNRDRAPYNLFFDVDRVWALNLPDTGTPPQQFQYRKQGETVNGLPSAGVVVEMDSYTIDWTWNAATGLYERSQNARPDKDSSGDLVTTDNVVVLVMHYAQGISGSPDAQSVGSGEAFVFTGGGAIHGTWTRFDRLAPFTLLDDAGNPMLLTPGRTFVELPREGDTAPK